MQILPEPGGKSVLRSVVITRRLLRRLVAMTRSFGFEPSLRNSQIHPRLWGRVVSARAIADKNLSAMTMELG